MSKSNNAVTYRQLEQLLTRCGFVVERTLGDQRMFTQQPTDSVVLLPPYKGDDRVRIPHLAGVRKTLVEHGVIDDGAFDELLRDGLLHEVEQ